jgi:hypothetical protein
MSENEHNITIDSSQATAETSNNNDGQQQQIIHNQTEPNQNDISLADQTNTIDWAAASEAALLANNNNSSGALQGQSSINNNYITSTPASSPNATNLAPYGQHLPNNINALNVQSAVSPNATNLAPYGQHLPNNINAFNVQSTSENLDTYQTNQQGTGHNGDSKSHDNSSNKNNKRNKKAQNRNLMKVNANQYYNSNSQINQNGNNQYYNNQMNQYQMNQNDNYNYLPSSYNPNIQQQYMGGQNQNNDFYNQQPYQQLYIQPQPTLFVADLDNNVTSQELKQFFNVNGQVTSVVIPRKKDEKGVIKRANFAFVNFNNWNAVFDAINHFQFIKYNNKYMRVTMYDPNAKDRKSNGEGNLYIVNLPIDVNPQLVFDYFFRYGKILSLKVIYFIFLVKF